MEVLLRKQSEADLFNDIEINDKYSSIAKKLPIIVGSNCFEDFKKKINTPIKVKVRNSISLLCENLKEIKNNNYKPFDPQKYLKYLEEETKRDLKKKKRKKLKIFTNERTLRNLEKNKLYQKEKEVLGFCKYHPNYDYIKGKTPSAIILSTKIIKSHSAKTLINDKDDSSNSSPQHITPKYKQKKNSILFQMHMNKFNNPTPPRNDSKSNSSEKQKRNSKKNSIIRKSSSLPLLSERNERKPKLVIDFKKMGKEERDIFNLQLDKEETIFSKGPSVGMYQPNYDSIFKISPKITINGTKPKHTKKFLMQRLWKSFNNLSATYELVKFPAQK